MLPRVWFDTPNGASKLSVMDDARHIVEVLGLEQSRSY